MKTIYWLKQLRYHIWYYNHHTKRFLAMDLPKLSSEEKSMVKQTWPGITFLPMDWVGLRVYKKIRGFSPYYLAPCWYNEIRKKTNPKDQLYALENKALLDVYFPEMSFPKPLVRGINGLYFDERMNTVSLSQAKQILMDAGEFVIKPSIGTNQGFGVKRITKDLSQKNYCDTIEKVILDAGKDFIAQEVLKQAPEIEMFNASSLNCFRVTTIYLNGRFDYVVALKIGKKGALRDNWNSGYWVKVDKDGILNEYGYDWTLNKVDKSDSGIVFKGKQMPCFREMIDHLEAMHKKIFPNCGVSGWDVTIDSDYKVRIVETNLWNPGTNIEQYVSGDFFKPFHDELLFYFSDFNKNYRQ